MLRQVLMFTGWRPLNRTVSRIIVLWIFNSCSSGSRALFSKESPIHKRNSSGGPAREEHSVSSLRIRPAHFLQLQQTQEVLWIFLVKVRWLRTTKSCRPFNPWALPYATKILASASTCSHSQIQREEKRIWKWKTEQDFSKSHKYPWEASLLKCIQCLCDSRSWNEQNKKKYEWML